MTVRPLSSSDVDRWIALRCDLWPDQAPRALDADGRAALAAAPPLVVFVAEADGTLVGFLELSLRSYAEGCDSSPVPYVEGWYVAPGHRRTGVGRALMDAAAAWSRASGFTEMGSDALVENRQSHAAHRAVGFQEVETIVVFRRAL